MPQVITATVSANVTVNETLTYGLATGASTVIQSLPTVSLSNGTTTSAVDLHWEKKSVTLAAGANTTYTLSALTDDLGRSVPLVKVRTLLVRPTTRTAGDYLTLGSAASNPWTTGPWGSGTSKVYAFSLWQTDLTDGYAVTASSSDQLKVVNSGSNSMTFDIAILGTSA